MAKTRGVDLLGKWAFLIGVILAVVLGLAIGSLTGTWAIVLVVIGLLVGLLNIGDHEIQPFLMSGVVLIIASAFGGSVMADVPFVGPVFDALLAVFVPATIIVALKNIFSLAKD